MGGPKDSTHRSKSASDHTTKKCPNCYAYLPLSARICTSCHARVGDVDKLGFAQKPIDWRAYLLAAVTMAAFAFFIWWAFFRE
jgi:ribosomal protein L40E